MTKKLKVLIRINPQNFLFYTETQARKPSDKEKP